MADQARGIALPLFERVSAERAAQGWSWTRLVDRAGVARSTIYKWATNETPPQPATVNAVADVLNIPRAEALRLAGILTDRPPELVPECTVEKVVIETEGLPIEMKRDFVRVHRLRGHSADCNPYAPGESRDESALASLSAAAL